MNLSLAGGDACPSEFLPQQIAEPSVLSPQVCNLPLLMALSGSSNGPDAGPFVSLPAPQHIVVPSGLKAHVWKPPLLIKTKDSPAGGDACPALSLPQQTGAPSNRRAQVWTAPLLIFEKVSPWGTVDWLDLSLAWSRLLPQQTGRTVLPESASVEVAAADRHQRLTFRR